MPKPKSVYVCTECGYETVRWLGKCPSCNMFNTLEECDVKPKSASEARIHISEAAALSEIEYKPENRFSTGIAELDRVLCGGIVEGSLVLIGGDPGIGKSTLLLQICRSIAGDGKRVLYVSGEESVMQIKLRAQRLSVSSPNIFLMSETCVNTIEVSVSKSRPQMLIIDSIQTMYSESSNGMPGSVSQVRESTAALMKIAKQMNICVVIVGHVTKEGAIAGPRVLEHMVDTVLYFEGEQRESYRIIRTVKNRFGATNEISVFEMHDTGLREIANPSEYMLSGRPVNVPGSVVTCTLPGTRPILAEVQALVSYTSFGTPRRMATGLDYNRVVMLIAVLEKKTGMQLGSFDSYVNIAGGMKAAEPSLDAAAAVAIASSFRNKTVDPYTLVFGEIGLAGEIRAVTMADKRVAEAAKLGFKKCVLPGANIKGLSKRGSISGGISIESASNVNELMELCLTR